VSGVVPTGAASFAFVPNLLGQLKMVAQKFLVDSGLTKGPKKGCGQWKKVERMFLTMPRDVL